ncbi:MAG: YhjD/YihY/BrkB family envelope integrity protein [Nitriliruptoraceae bacterium]
MKQRLLDLPVIGTALRVQDRYVRDAADPLAAAIAFFAFLSLFPLLLLAISVAGFVLRDPDDQLAVAEQLTGAIPGFDQTVGAGDSQVAELLANVVSQRGTIGVIGLLVLLFAGRRVINAAMVSTRVVFRAPLLLGIGKWLRQLLALVALGLLAMASTTASSFAGIGLGFVPSSVAVLLSSLVSFVLDVGLFLAAYTFLAPSAVLSVRDRVPGAVLAGAGWTALKVAGATWVSAQVESANALYGALGSVIALLLLFYLAGRLYLYGAVLSAVRYEGVHGPLIAPHQLDELGVDQHEPDTEVSGGTAAGRGRLRGASRSVAKPDADGPPPPPRAAGATPRTDAGSRRAADPVTPGTRGRFAATDGARTGLVRANGPSPSSPALGPRTAALDAEANPGGRDTRTAIGFALAIGSLAAGWHFLGGRDR